MGSRAFGSCRSAPRPHFTWGGASRRASVRAHDDACVEDRLHRRNRRAARMQRRRPRSGARRRQRARDRRGSGRPGDRGHRRRTEPGRRHEPLFLGNPRTRRSSDRALRCTRGPARGMRNARRLHGGRRLLPRSAPVRSDGFPPPGGARSIDRAVPHHRVRQRHDLSGPTGPSRVLHPDRGTDGRPTPRRGQRRNPGLSSGLHPGRERLDRRPAKRSQRRPRDRGLGGVRRSDRRLDRARQRQHGAFADQRFDQPGQQRNRLRSGRPRPGHGAARRPADPGARNPDRDLAGRQRHPKPGPKPQGEARHPPAARDPAGPLVRSSFRPDLGLQSPASSRPETGRRRIEQLGRVGRGLDRRKDAAGERPAPRPEPAGHLVPGEPGRRRLPRGGRLLPRFPGDPLGPQRRHRLGRHHHEPGHFRRLHRRRGGSGPTAGGGFVSREHGTIHGPHGDLRQPRWGGKT